MLPFSGFWNGNHHVIDLRNFSICHSDSVTNTGIHQIKCEEMNRGEEREGERNNATSTQCTHFVAYFHVMIELVDKNWQANEIPASIKMYAVLISRQK